MLKHRKSKVFDNILPVITLLDRILKPDNVVPKKNSSAPPHIFRAITPDPFPRGGDAAPTPPG